MTVVEMATGFTVAFLPLPRARVVDPTNETHPTLDVISFTRGEGSRGEVKRSKDRHRRIGDHESGPTYSGHLPFEGGRVC